MEVWVPRALNPLRRLPGCDQRCGPKGSLGKWCGGHTLTYNKCPSVGRSFAVALRRCLMETTKREWLRLPCLALRNEVRKLVNAPVDPRGDKVNLWACESACLQKCRSETQYVRTYEIYNFSKVESCTYDCHRSFPIHTYV